MARKAFHLVNILIHVRIALKSASKVRVLEIESFAFKACGSVARNTACSTKLARIGGIIFSVSGRTIAYAGRLK